MNKIHVKPAIEGHIVRKPVTMTPLDKDGEIVEESSYWVRRLQDGDVVLVEEQKTEKENEE